MKKNLRILTLLLALSLSLCLFCACTPENPGIRNTNSATAAAENTVSITVTVVKSSGESKAFPIETKKTTLADALLEAKLVEGEMSAYGLYIKVVDGETADYNTNGAYWSLYIGEEMALSGASDIEISDGAQYKLVYTK